MTKNLSILLILLTTCIYAQKEKSTKLGQTSLEEVQMNIYDKDSTAAAVVLFEHGNQYLDASFDYQTRTDYYYRIKILNSRAFDLANVNISTYDKQLAKNIKGITYNLTEGGALIKYRVKEEEIFEVDVNNKRKSHKFTLPNIKEGSVIEYSYSIISPYLSIKDWNFQSDIPKVKSQYNASILGNYKYHIRLVGSQKLSENEAKLDKECIYIDGLGRGACAVYTYAMENIPAFKEEAYMLSEKNYKSKLAFDLKTYTSPRGGVEKYTTTWKEADKKLKSIFFNKQTSKKGYFKKRLPEEIFTMKDELAKSKSIYDFIQNHFSWNDRYWNSEDERVKDAFDERTGSAGEINLSLYNSLQAAEIDCDLVILSTRDNGIPTKLFPVIFDFNYVIVKANIQGKEYYLDATDKFLPFGQVPFRCLNTQARVVNFKKESNWVELKPKYGTQKISSAKLILNNDGTLTGQLSEKNIGYNAISKRKEIANSTTDSYLEDFESEYPFIEVDDYKVIDEKEIEKPINEVYDVSINLDETLENKIRLNPFLMDRTIVNPFKLKERNYPVDFGFTRKNNFYLNLKIPDNYKVTSLPENKAIALPGNGATYMLKTTQRENVLNIYVRFNIRKKVFIPSEYAALKQFFNEIVEAEKGYITLEKI